MKMNFFVGIQKHICNRALQLLKHFDKRLQSYDLKLVFFLSLGRKKIIIKKKKLTFLKKFLKIRYLSS
jgi:hypothetical protein